MLIKSSQTAQLNTTKVFYKQFSCHHHINKSVFATNLQFNHTIKTKLQAMLLIFIFFPFLKMFKISLLDPDMKKKKKFATNLFKINIFWLSLITRLKPYPTRRVLYYVFPFLKIFKISFLNTDMKTNIFRPKFCLINIFIFSLITWLEQEFMRNVRYLIFFILHDIFHVKLKEFNIWLS